MVSAGSRAEVVPPTAVPLTSGTRSGALLAAASAASIVLNYVFLLTAGRILGSAGYGTLAALLGLLAVVLIPTASLQMAVSREISRRVASADDAGARSFANAAVRYSLLATVPLLVVAFALAVPLAHVLHIHSVAIMVVTELTLSTALVFPVAMGVIQGFQRFRMLAAMYIAPFMIRLPLFGIGLAVGARLGAAIVATLIGSVAATIVAVAAGREAGRREHVLPRAELVTFLRYLAPVTAGLVGIALLTHVDILVVKARLTANDAGAYAAASAFARVGFFLPATILSVIFPRTAARQARGEQTDDILGRSLIATIVFCALLALFYEATGRGIVSMTFGRDFAHGGNVLAPFALAIGLYSLAYILVGYHLSRGESRYAWIVGAAVLVQVAALALVPRSLHDVVWANLAVAGGLVIAHEIFVGPSARAIRAGARHFTGTGARVRALLPETAAVLLGTTAFVCILFWPVVLHFGSTIIGAPGSDSTGSVADFWQMHREGGYHILGSMHHTMSGAPFGWDETNIIKLQLLLPYYPTYLLSLVIGPVAAYNLITLAGFVLSGASMYLLVRYLGCRPLVAVWAAVAFIVFPYHLAHEEHASLVHLECLVFLLLALVAVVRRPTAVRFVLLGVANVACWLMSGYFGPMAFITTFAFTVGVALVWRTRRALLVVAASGAAALVAAGIIGVATVASGANTGLGLQRLPADLSSLGVRAADLLVPAAGNIVFGGGLTSFWSKHLHGSNSTEISNYLGLLTLALAIGWLILLRRRRHERVERLLVAPTAGLVAAFVVGLLFALPSPWHGFTMPSRILWHFVSAFHVPSRWDFLLMTALVPLAALGLEALTARVGRRGAVAAALVVGLATVVSFVELTIHPARPRWRTVPVPAEYEALKDAPNGILAEYPLGYADLYRIWQRVHGRALVNGAPAGTPADSGRLMILDPAEPGTAQALALLGVAAITFHPNGHADTPVPPREPTARDGYTLIARAPDGTSVWDVVAPPEPAFATLGGFSAPQRTAQGFIGYTFAGANGVGAIDLAARAPAVIRLFFDAVPPGGRTVLRIADSKTEQQIALNGPTHASVVVAVPRGQSRLLVKADVPVVISTPRTQAVNAQPALHADLLSPKPGI